MSMQANIRSDLYGNITVQMQCGMNYENSIPLRNELEEIATLYPNSNIILDMNTVDFVGSSGIGLFVETIKTINDKVQRIRLSNVKKEFQRVFKLYDMDALNDLIIDFDNDETQYLGQNFANRSRTFEN